MDGPGLRFSAFVQGGAAIIARGATTERASRTKAGIFRRWGELCERIANNASVSGVTLTGGEPFEQPEACLALPDGVRRVG